MRTALATLKRITIRRGFEGLIERQGTSMNRWYNMQSGLVLLLVCCFVSMPATAQYSGGSGTADDPYQIATAADLIALGGTPEDYGKHFILTADIDLDPNLPGGRVFDRAVIAPDINDTENWYQGPAFTGFFDGHSHVIRNLHIQGRGFLGLFGEFGDGSWPMSTVKDLGLVDVHITGTGGSIGGLVGWNCGTVSQCYSSGSVSGQYYVGGLVGSMGDFEIYEVLIASCYSTASVSGDAAVGGLVGYAVEGSIRSSYSTGSVTATEDGGGLGGFIFGYVDITSCFWDVETSGQLYSDGGFGLTTAEMMDPKALGLIGLAGDPNWVLDVGRDYPRLAWEGRPGQVIPEPIIDWLDGDGTEQEPYRIDTPDQLVLLGRASVLWNEHFVLGADIDLDPNLPGRKIFHQAVIASSGTGALFTGVFDGKGHTISHLTIRGIDYLGLFGQTGSGARILSLGLEGLDINGRDRVGSLVGYNNAGSITNCCSSGTVSGQSPVGGLVGYNAGKGSITTCYSTGSVHGGWCVGGLIGYNYGSITNCYSSGSVTGQYHSVGGLVGANGRDGSITHCYSSGMVKGDWNVGGLVGSSHPDDSITSSFWDIQTSEQKTSSGGGVGLTTAEMQTASPFLAAGWDFVGETANGTEAVWKIVEGLTYPLLSWQKYSGGTGEPNDPYQIATAADLIALGEDPNDYSKHFILTTDIELDPNLPGGSVFDRAVIAPDVNDTDPYGPHQGPAFTGVFDGNRHVIRNLHIRGGGNLGLFGVASRASISNLGLEAVDISGTGGYVGGLVGLNHDGSITNCHSSGTVIDFGGYVGGLVGQNYSPPLTHGSRGCITKCYSTVSVNGQRSVGGLVGGNSDSSITNCYSTGPVTGDSSVGGLVGSTGGFFYGSITMCYSTGSVNGQDSVGGLVGTHWNGTITSCVWDVQTSGQKTSSGGMGLTTAEMQTAKTFLDAGWDFVGETANGTADLWWIDEGKDYPRLWWEAQD